MPNMTVLIFEGKNGLVVQDTSQNIEELLRTVWAPQVPLQKTTIPTADSNMLAQQLRNLCSC